MKKAMPLFIAFALISSLILCAFAESEATPVLGGTKVWPEFRGMQFGLSSTAVIYREADEGIPIICHRNGDTAIDVAEAATARAYPVITSEPIEAFGKGAYLRYEFQDGTFMKATLYWPMDNADEALKWLGSVREEAEAVFGTPDELSLITADGQRIHNDLRDEAFSAFIENYDGATPFFGWDLGKLYSFSAGSPEQYEGVLNVYIKNVEPETLEAAIGLETGKPAVVLHVARLVSPRAAGSYLPE